MGQVGSDWETVKMRDRFKERDGEKDVQIEMVRGRER